MQTHTWSLAETEIVRGPTASVLLKLATRLLSRCAAIFFLVFVLISVAVILFRPQELWALKHFSGVPLLVLAHLIGFVCSWHTFSYEKHRRFLQLQSALVLLSLYVLVQGPTNLGDVWAKSITAEQFLIGKSSILAIALYIGSASVGFPQALIPPFAGFISALVAFAIIDELSKDSQGVRHTNKALLGNTLYLATSVHLLFFREYLEMAQVAIPFLLASLLYGIRYARPEEAHSQRSLALCATFLGLASATHGANTFLLPIIPLLILFRRLPRVQFRTLFRDAGLSLKTLLIAPIFMCGIVALFGIQLTAGDIYGGGDARFFVSFSGPLIGYERYNAFAAAHFYEIGNLLLITVPLCLVFCASALFSLKRFFRFFENPAALFLGFASLGYFSLVFLHNFDLGYPVDLDLMTSMSTPFLLLTIYAVIHWLPQRVSYVFGALGTVFVWGYISPFLTSPWFTI